MSWATAPEFGSVQASFNPEASTVREAAPPPSPTMVRLGEQKASPFENLDTSMFAVPEVFDGNAPPLPRAASSRP